MQAVQEGPNDSGCRSVSICLKIGGEDCGGVQDVGAGAESGSSRERQGVKGASDALWRVQYHLRWKAHRAPSDQCNEVHEHHAQECRTRRSSECRGARGYRGCTRMSWARSPASLSSLSDFARLYESTKNYLVSSFGHHRFDLLVDDSTTTASSDSNRA